MGRTVNVHVHIHTHPCTHIFTHNIMKQRIRIMKLNTEIRKSVKFRPGLNSYSQLQDYEK